MFFHDEDLSTSSSVDDTLKTSGHQSGHLQNSANLQNKLAPIPSERVFDEGLEGSANDYVDLEQPESRNLALPRISLESGTKSIMKSGTFSNGSALKSGTFSNSDNKGSGSGFNFLTSPRRSQKAEFIAEMRLLSKLRHPW